MGLLDGLLNSQDPQAAAMLSFIAPLLGARKGDNALGQGLLGAVNASQKARQQKMMEDLHKQEMEQRAMQMQQVREQMARQQQEQALAGQFARPAVQQQGPTPDGSQMPQQSPASFDYQGYAGAMAGIDPMRALGMQSQLAQMGAKEAFTLKPGERRYQGDKVVAEGGPEAQKVGALREVKSGSNTLTFEWDGEKWAKISSAPTHKPDGPEKPAAPHLYEGPNGPVWIQPPARGDGAQPAMGADGKPIGPKVTEAAKKEMMTLDQEIASIKGAQDAAKKTQSAFGLKRGAATLAGAIPESIAGRMDSKDEKEARAYVFNVVSKAINERAGAAQSAQELARLRSFLPAETDDAAQIDAKLNGYTRYLTDRRNAVTSGGQSTAPAAPTNNSDPLGIRGK